MTLQLKVFLCIHWIATALSISLNKNGKLEIGLELFRILQSQLDFLINGFTRTVFIGLEKTPFNNDKLTIFVIGLIRMS